MLRLNPYADHGDSSKETLAYAMRPEAVAKAELQANKLFQQLVVIYHKH